MLICIPTRGNAGRDDVVFDHLGSAPYFIIYDSAAGEITVLENRNEHHSHGACHPMDQLARYHIDCVVCSGMGRRAIEALRSVGIGVYRAPSQNVAEVIEAFETGRLSEIDPASACRGHGQGAPMAGGCRAGVGRGGEGQGGAAGLKQGRD